MIITSDELRPGLVAHLDSDMLIKSGRLMAPPGALLPMKTRPFLILWRVVSDGEALVHIVPLYSNQTTCRIGLENEHKIGGPQWVSSTSCYHPASHYLAPAEVICAASRSERTQPGWRAGYAVYRPGVLMSIEFNEENEFMPVSPDAEAIPAPDGLFEVWRQRMHSRGSIGQAA
ncbi:MAG: hypothetical protein PHI71_08440 [Acidiphilium sp.]|nr:hypothetical protein [Acidiphilium sp.]